MVALRDAFLSQRVDGAANRQGEEVAAILKAIHAQEDAQVAKEKGRQVVAKLRKMRLGKTAAIAENGIEETLSYYAMPPEHWRCIETNNPLERPMRDIRRRMRVVGAFPDGKNALMLAAGRRQHVAATKWGSKITSTQQPSQVPRKIESAKSSGHNPADALHVFDYLP